MGYIPKHNYDVLRLIALISPKKVAKAFEKAEKSPIKNIYNAKRETVIDPDTKKIVYKDSVAGKKAEKKLRLDRRGMIFDPIAKKDVSQKSPRGRSILKKKKEMSEQEIKDNMPEGHFYNEFLKKYVKDTKIQREKYKKMIEMEKEKNKTRKGDCKKNEVRSAFTKRCIKKKSKAAKDSYEYEIKELKHKYGIKK